ncbi:uncharacterized protein BXZ73DRAFT_21737, partial [Epithele typhae]|uniref:uncharacterized protein n=1 Tax=Epithele typhae TaxID=378194 RepID=UPI002007311C
RVTLTDYRGNIIYDTYVQPTQPVADYRTAETGLRREHLEHAPQILDVRHQVATLLQDKILVGYALWELLSVMRLAHPAISTRDTALFMSFRRSLGYKPRHVVPLPELVKRFMGHDIGLHGDVPVERARAALDLFRSCETTWEGMIATGAWPCALPPDDYRAHFT